jgi:hypothetical protein
MAPAPAKPLAAPHKPLAQPSQALPVDSKARNRADSKKASHRNPTPRKGQHRSRRIRGHAHDHASDLPMHYPPLQQCIAEEQSCIASISWHSPRIVIATNRRTIPCASHKFDRHGSRKQFSAETIDVCFAPDAMCNSLCPETGHRDFAQKPGHKLVA